MPGSTFHKLMSYFHDIPPLLENAQRTQMKPALPNKAWPQIGKVSRSWIFDPGCWIRRRRLIAVATCLYSNKFPALKGQII
jgi:hypothetical protein